MTEILGEPRNKLLQLASRRSFLAQGLSLSVGTGVLFGGAHVASGATHSETAAWGEILADANRFVADETPSGALPFDLSERDRLTIASSPRKVFADYFTPYPLSIRNKPLGQDSYDEQLLNPEGQQARFKSVGGYIRERPLAPNPWAGPDWALRNMAIDVLRAKKIGLDGFIVDMLRLNPSPSFDTIVDFYQVAARLDPGFVLVPEPDSAGLKDVTPEEVAATILLLARMPSSFRLSDGRLVVSPFAPEKYSITWWNQFNAILNSKGIRIALLPTFLAPARSAASFSSLAIGLSYWGLRDFLSVNSAPDAAIHKLLKSYNTRFMQPVAPQDVRPKVASFAEAGNTRLFRGLWMQAIEENASFVHLITWNDFSESTEIEPSSGTHFIIYDLTAYFTTWFKLGRQPFITRDSVYYCHRREMIPGGELDRRLHLIGATPISNQIEMLAFLKQDAILQIEINGAVYQTVGQGGRLTAFYIEARPGKPSFRIIRGGRVDVAIQSAWSIRPSNSGLDPLYVGGSSNRIT